MQKVQRGEDFGILQYISNTPQSISDACERLLRLGSCIDILC